MITPLCRLLAVAACAAPLLAQDQRGPLLGAPTVLMVGPGTVSSSGAVPGDELLARGGGFGPVGVVGPSPAPGAISFAARDIWGQGQAPPPFTVNAYSIGRDEVLATIPMGGQSWVSVPPTAWGAVEFSVTRDSTGRPGTVIRAEDGTPSGAGADLFTLMLDGSDLDPSVLPCYPFDRAQKAADSTEFDLAGPFALTEGEVSAVDYYTPLYEAGPPITPLLPAEPKVYFSVTHDSIVPPGGGASVVPASWFGTTLPSSATILETQWSPASLTWGAPQVFLPYSALGLDVDDDIDGLAVDPVNCKVLFSIVRTATSTLAEQLQIAHFTKTDSSYLIDVVVGDYVTPDGTGGAESVARRAGLDVDDDIDGVCTIDPAGQDGAGGRLYGTPAFAITPFKPLYGQVYRDRATGGVPTVTSVVAGLPAGPTLPPQTIQLWLGTTIGGSYTILPMPVYVSPLDGSDPSGTRSVSFVDPGLSVSLGLLLDFIWVQRPPAPVTRSAPVMRILL